MMHEIGLELLAKLRDRDCPFPVVDGPEFAPATWAKERIVIEEAGGDSFGGPFSVAVNPKRSADMVIGGRVSIYVKSPKDGAKLFEHRRRCRHVVRMVLVALREVLIERKNPVTFTGGDYFTPPDLAKTEQASGAAYALTFEIHTGVPALTWAGDKAPEAEIGGVGGVEINTTRRVSTDGENFETF